jgi:hypothetical protein
MRGGATQIGRSLPASIGLALGEAGRRWQAAELATPWDTTMTRLFALLLLLCSFAVQAAPMENKWRLQFSGNAHSDGVLVLAITPKGGEQILVEVPVKDRTGENAVARQVRDVLRAQVGKDYKVERDDGEDVLVKRRSGRPVFSVEVVSNSIRGVRLSLDRE